MTRRTTAITLSLAVAVTGIGVGAAAAANPSSTMGVTATTTISSDLKHDLAFSRDEERMARDLYTYIAAKYDGARPFSNIVKSEQRHYDAVGTLLNRYGIADPASGKPAGTYANPDIQKLYDGWKARADASLQEAYKVGVDLEKRDIADLKNTLNLHLPNDVKNVFSSLLRGSENHLKAFTRASDGTRMGHAPGQGMQQGRGPGNGMSPGGGMRGGTCVSSTSTSS